MVRSTKLAKGMNKKDDIQTSLALLSQDIRYIQKDIMEIKAKIENDYVTREEFDPIKKISYGLIAIVLTSFIAAVLSLIVKK